MLTHKPAINKDTINPHTYTHAEHGINIFTHEYLCVRRSAHTTSFSLCPITGGGSGGGPFQSIKSPLEARSTLMDA